MRCLFAGVPLLLAFAAFAAPQATKAPQTIREARRAFEAEWGTAFGPKKALPAQFCATDAAAFGDSSGEWICAFPLEDGDRLFFARIIFQDGRFARGEVHYMGLPAQTLTADDYATLRRSGPLAAVPAAATNPVPVRVLAPVSVPLSFPIPKRMRTNLRIDPLNKLFGGFLDVIANRLRVKTDALAFRVVHMDAQGVRREIGTVRNVRGETELTDRKVLDAIGAARPDLISDRARTDWFVTGSLSYEPVSAQ